MAELMLDPYFPSGTVFRNSELGMGALPRQSAGGMVGGARPAETLEQMLARVRLLTASTAPAPVAPPVMAAPVAEAAAAAKPAGLLSRILPGWGAVKTAGRFGLAAAPVMGAVGAAMDSPEAVKGFADKTGMEYDSFGGRVMANVGNFLQQTGNSIPLVSTIGKGFARMSSGQSFFEPYAPTAPATGAAPAVDVGQASPELTRADILAGVNPAPGTGAILNNSTGRVTNLNTGRPRTTRVITTVRPESEEDSYTNTAKSGTMASAVGAILNMKGRAADAEARVATRTAQAKAMGTPKDRAEAAEIQARLALAGVAPNLTAAGAILNKHNPPERKIEFPPGLQPLPGGEPVAVGADPYSQRVFKIPIAPVVQPITMAEAVASAKKNGTYKSDAQVRKDMATKSQFSLVD